VDILGLSTPVHQAIHDLPPSPVAVVLRVLEADLSEVLRGL
jgi:hypothetical protein